MVIIFMFVFLVFFFLLFLSLYLVVKYVSRICYLWPIAFGGEKSAVRALAHFYCVAESVFESTEAQVDWFTSVAVVWVLLMLLLVVVIRIMMESQTETRRLCCNAGNWNEQNKQQVDWIEIECGHIVQKSLINLFSLSLALFFLTDTHTKFLLL